jgi:hypothetical protein
MRRILVCNARLVSVVIALCGWAPLVAHGESELVTTQYRVAYVGASASDFEEVFKGDDATPAGQVPKGAQRIKTHLTAQLDETVLEEGPEGSLVLHALRGLTVFISVNEAPALEYIKELKDALTHPVAVRYSPSGRVERVFMQPGLKDSGGAVWSLLLGYRQFVGSPSSPTLRFVKEDDANGTYRARYIPSAVLDIVPDVGLQIIGKQKVEYLPEPFKWIPGEGVSDKLVTTTHDEIWVYDGSRLAAMNGVGDLYISVAGKAVAYAEGQYKLEYAGQETLEVRAQQSVATMAAQLVKNGAAKELWEPEISTGHLQKMHAQELKGRSLAHLLEAVLTADKEDGERRAQRTPMYMAFQAIAYLYPEEIKLLKKPILAMDRESMPFRVIIAALAQIGNPEAQSFLRWLFKKYPKDPEVRVLMLSSLSDVRGPTPESVALLRHEAVTSKHNLEKHSAELGLGTMALMLRTDHPARSAEIDRWLIEQLQTAKDDERKEDMLRAVGNSGGAETLAALQPYLDTANKKLRRLAVSALRWNRTAQAGSILLGALATDPEESVRAAAVSAFQIRPMTVAAKPVHEKTATGDSSAALRLASLGNLLRMRYRHPDVLDFIRARALKDPDEETRGKIQELLEGTE